MDIPAFINMAKSPNSWGNSWQNTARDVEKPPARFSAKAAPVEDLFD